MQRVRRFLRAGDPAKQAAASLGRGRYAAAQKQCGDPRPRGRHERLHRNVARRATRRDYGTTPRPLLRGAPIAKRPQWRSRMPAATAAAF